MRRTRDELAASSIREEVFVEGNTFHEYSTAIKSRTLYRTVNNDSRKSESLLTARGRREPVFSS
jgi:hypothetical protein